MAARHNPSVKSRKTQVISGSARTSASPTSSTKRWRTGRRRHASTRCSALAFADEIVKLHKPTDATFKAIASKLTPAALVELQLSEVVV